VIKYTLSALCHVLRSDRMKQDWQVPLVACSERTRNQNSTRPSIRSKRKLHLCRDLNAKRSIALVKPRHAEVSYNIMPSLCPRR